MKGVIFAFTGLLLVVCYGLEAAASCPPITPSSYWKNQIVHPDEPFRVIGTSSSDPDWVKFTILACEPNTVYFQDSQMYAFHYTFATELLEPFIGMSPYEYDQVTLYESGQQAILGAVIMPPSGCYPAFPIQSEYGIQLVRRDPYTKEEVAGLFNAVKTNIIADPSIVAFYFPSYEQQVTDQNDRDWFESQGIPISSSARWAEGNVCYSEGWALGQLKFFEADEIDTAYLNGLLEPNDILLTDGVPAEIPFVAGIISLSPATPSSHVAILAKTFRVPFVYLALAEDANRAQQLIGRKIVLRAFYERGLYEVRLIDVQDTLDDATITQILALKAPPPLDISPMAHYGHYSVSTDGLAPSDIQYFGGKAANFGILRTAIGDNSPFAVAFSFDLWNGFLDQILKARQSVSIGPGEYLLFWADNDEEQGPTHTNFKLSAGGEYVGLYDRDGITLIDGLTFGAQSGDVSYGRLPDGNDNWVFFDYGTATPGWSNSGGSGGPEQGLFINEFMADNDTTIQDPDGGGYPDWIELYNAGTSTLDLGGMYLTDDINDPTKWMIPFAINGGSLREEIINRLLGYSYPPPDMAALSADLAAIREGLFRNIYVTSFKQPEKNAVINALQEPAYGLDPNSKIRFRSSTNVEDSNQFTGAGLYDSYSGCLADDLDSDDFGPCICDPCEDNERGVFRAIRKVFASFYNDNAYLERLRYGVNEADVGMALLVHHSFPDEIELANGVATLEKKYTLRYDIQMVTQLEAISVANPTDGSIPEEVSIYVGSIGIYPTLVQSSNLMPLGATVMNWQDDYIELSQLLVAAAEQFQLVTGKTTCVLDFEYKKLAPGGAAMPSGGLVVKQIRQIPQPDTTPTITPFLVNELAEFRTFQGEASNVFANHRLKSKWGFKTKNLWLDESNLTETIYADVYLEYAAEGRIRTLTAALPLLPFASHTFEPNDTTDNWLMHHLQNQRTCHLRTNGIPTLVSEAQNPIWTISDFDFGHLYDSWLGLHVDYKEPVPMWNWDGPNTTITDEVILWTSPQPHIGDTLQQRSFYDPNGISVSISFYWPPPPPGAIAGYTAPLSRWVETIIEGYTTEPVILHDYYSQTYRPEHHNFSEHFLFEPQLEPGISQDILDELYAQDIRLIHVFSIFGDPNIMTYGFDSKPFFPGDLDDDDDTDFSDFALLAERWLESVCDTCGGADLNGDGRVRMDDLKQFTDEWLSGL